MNARSTLPQDHRTPNGPHALSSELGNLTVRKLVPVMFRVPACDLESLRLVAARHRSTLAKVARLAIGRFLVDVADTNVPSSRAAREEVQR